MFQLYYKLLYYSIIVYYSCFYGSESISYLGSKICDILPLELKELTSVAAFKKGFKEWKLKYCPFRPHKKYITNSGFITVTS